MSQLVQEGPRIAIFVLPGYRNGNEFAENMAYNLNTAYYPGGWFEAQSIPIGNDHNADPWSEDDGVFARYVGQAINELAHFRPQDLLGIVIANGQRENDALDGGATWRSGVSESTLVALEAHHGAVPMGLLRDPQVDREDMLDPQGGMAGRIQRLKQLQLPILYGIEEAPGLALQFNRENLRRVE